MAQQEKLFIYNQPSGKDLQEQVILKKEAVRLVKAPYQVPIGCIPSQNHMSSEKNVTSGLFRSRRQCLFCDNV